MCNDLCMCHGQQSTNKYIFIQIDFRKKVDEKEERLRREEVEGEREIQEESRKLQLLRYCCTACMFSVQCTTWSLN